MKDEFNRDEAKKFLKEREEKEREKNEEERKRLFAEVASFLKSEFYGSHVEVFLIGSILVPFGFSSRSDIDIVLKNYHGDRFDFWAKLEEKTGRSVEIIPFETCPFQEYVLKSGFRII